MEKKGNICAYSCFKMSVLYSCDVLKTAVYILLITSHVCYRVSLQMR